MSSEEWKSGWPEERGLYHCKVDGEKKALVHHYCCNNGKHWWSTTSGHDVVGCEILWRDKIVVK